MEWNVECRERDGRVSKPPLLRANLHLDCNIQYCFHTHPSSNGISVNRGQVPSFCNESATRGRQDSITTAKSSDGCVRILFIERIIEGVVVGDSGLSSSIVPKEGWRSKVELWLGLALRKADLMVLRMLLGKGHVALVEHEC